MRWRTNPLFPASGPATGSFNGLHAKSKFLAAEQGADLWYGVMNQARLNLMAKYRWEEKGKPRLNQCEDPQERRAILREGFYLQIQSLILGHLWDE